MGEEGIFTFWLGYGEIGHILDVGKSRKVPYTQKLQAMAQETVHRSTYTHGINAHLWRIKHRTCILTAIDTVQVHWRTAYDAHGTSEHGTSAYES